MHKLARTVYYMLLCGEPFREERAAVYEERRKERELKQLTRRAQKLGYQFASVLPKTAAASVQAP